MLVVENYDDEPIDINCETLPCVMLQILLFYRRWLHKNHPRNKAKGGLGKVKLQWKGLVLTYLKRRMRR
nr:hypothetical protein Itr_chr11CG19640 [Ipomoea trifida]